MQSPRVWGSLQLLIYQDWKALHRYKDTWMPRQRVYKPECKEQKKQLVKKKKRLNSDRFAQTTMPGFDFILHWEDLVFFQALSKWAECISTMFRGGAGNWASMAMGKTCEWLHSISWNTVCQRWLEIPNPCCSSKQDYSQPWMGTVEALSHCVWASSRSWGVMSSLNSLSHSALACLWDLWVAFCYGQHASWTKGGSMRCRQMNK